MSDPAPHLDPPPPRAARAPRFLCDAMLGRLARWLRVLGYDTHYDADISDVRALALCQREDRILITRDRQLAQRARGVQALLLDSHYLDEQLARVVAACKLDLSQPHLTRCLICNRRTRAVTREEVAPLVPPYVLATTKEFTRCPKCGRVYWPGTHRARIEVRLRRLSA